MSQVPDKVLSWLYSVLHEYQDPQRTYSDAARVLSAFPSLSPRTEVYTYENGSSALLLTVSGTLPVDFRGATYRFPIKLWVPQSYPQESPIVYVMPGRDMLVRPGQHVGVEGRVYHPYLSDWSGMWDRANIADFLGYLQQAFAREPPLVSKAQQQQLQRPMAHQQYQAQQTPGASPAPPQLPPKQHPGSHTPIEMPSANTPPPRPPKPGDEGISRGPSRNYATDGPPLPPLPGQNPQNSQYPPRVDGYSSTRPPHPSAYSGVHQNGQTTRQSPLPALPQHVQQEQQRLAHDVSPVSPVSPPHAQVNTPGNRYSQPPPLPAQPHNQVHPSYQQGPAPPQQAQYQQQPQAYHPSQTQPQPNPQYNPQHQQYVPRQTQQPPPQPKKQPPPDLLSDPFEVALPSSSGPSVPAPPIPPNPEKEHLLQAISTSLVQQAQQKVNQNMSAIAPLQAQQNALRAAHARLEAEIAQLEALDATLSTNESILHRSIQDCNHTISEAKSKKQPPIDEVLVAPTLVAQQLWTLTAEEAACREAMYVLQKAVDRGRISGSDFVRQMRGLGRESFLKMVLARKCATGLGLDVDR